MIKRRSVGNSKRSDTEYWPRRLVTKVCVLVMVLSVMLVVASACGSDPVRQARKADAAGNLKSAVSLYRDRLKEKPEDLAALRGLAVDLYLMGSFDEALPVQEKVVALDSKDSQTRVELGFNYLNHQRQAGKAAAVLAQAAALEPTAKYLTFEGQAQIAAGETQGAESTLRRAMVVDRSYGHAYVVLIALLQGQGRTSEAAALRAAAQDAGVTIQVGQSG